MKKHKIFNFLSKFWSYFLFILFYTAGPYFVSKFICELIPNRLIPLIFYSTITYWMSGLWKSFNTWLLWLLPIVNIGFASGSVLMLYCSLIPDFRGAIQCYIL